MTPKKARNIWAHQQPSASFGIHSRRFIRISKTNLDRLSTLRFHCNQCKRWLPALAFYAQVGDLEGEVQVKTETPNDAVYLSRYEVKAEGFKGRETVVVCEVCAEGGD